MFRYRASGTPQQYSPLCGVNMDVKDFTIRIMEVPYKLGGRCNEGLDCWGLVVMAYKDLFGLDVPTYEDTAWSVSNDDTTSEDIKNHLERSAPFVEVEKPHYGDFVLVNILGQPVHIGFMIDHKTMLHTSEKTGVVCEDIGGMKWKKRIKGFYRHVEMI